MNPPRAPRVAPAWTRIPGRLLVAFLLLLLPLGPPPAARGQKTVFRSQPTEWNPDLEEDGAERIEFHPVWTFSGFSAPLAGDPVASGGLFLAASRSGEVAALAPADGHTVWMRDLGEPLDLGPATAGASVLIATRAGRVWALEAGSGIPLWNTGLGAAPTAQPRLAGGRLLVPTETPEIISLDPDTGMERARRALPGRAGAAAEPAADDAVIGTDHGMVLRFDPRTLDVRWRRYVRLPVTAPLLVTGDRVYVGATNTLRSLRLRDGRPKYTARAAARITARPFISGPYLYALCYDNDIYVLKARNGHLVARMRMANRLDSASLVSDGHVLLVPYTAGSLVGLSLPGLRPAGQFDLGIPGEWFTTTPAREGDRVAIGYGRAIGQILALTVTRADAGEPDDRKPEAAG